MFKKKNNRGFTLIEVLIGSILFLILFIGVSYVLKDRNERNRFNDLAYDIAYNMSELSKKYELFLQDNIGETLDDEILLQKLIVEGYIDGNSSDYQTQFGLTPSLYLQKDSEGSPLTIALVLEGEELKEKMENFDIESTEKLQELYRKTIEDLNSMITSETVSAGILNKETMTVKWTNSDKVLDFSQYMENDRVKDLPTVSPVLFLNIQENSGYYVISVNSTSRLTGDGSGNPDNGITMEGLGYSRFCPSPNLQPNGVNYSSYDNEYTIKIDEDERRNTGSGDFSRNFYLCLPASEFGADSYSREEFTVSNLNEIYVGEYTSLGQCRILHYTNFGVEFELRDKEYQFIGSLGRANSSCKLTTVYTYQNFELAEGEFEYDEFNTVVIMDENSPPHRKDYVDGSNPNFYIKDTDVTEIEIDY
jgi:prepilin-type N-terminal cleavage/methylation domain-containing protein